MVAANQAIRNGDYRHAQSLGRQRKVASIANPHQQAEAIAIIVRKRSADGQSVPDLDSYGLSDAVWAELLDILAPDELSAVGDAAGAEDLADSDDEPSANDVKWRLGMCP